MKAYSKAIAVRLSSCSVIYAASRLCRARRAGRGHGALARLSRGAGADRRQLRGTIDITAATGHVFFNDPLPTPTRQAAIEMAVAMREAAQGLLRSWRRHGYDIGFGVGISQGYATLGRSALPSAWTTPRSAR